MQKSWNCSEDDQDKLVVSLNIFVFIISSSFWNHRYRYFVVFANSMVCDGRLAMVEQQPVNRIQHTCNGYSFVRSILKLKIEQ